MNKKKLIEKRDEIEKEKRQYEAELNARLGAINALNQLIAECEKEELKNQKKTK